MAQAAGQLAGLMPIDEVARRLGLRASAIRYYEERGLVQPASRHSGGAGTGQPRSGGWRSSSTGRKPAG
jgi:MerR family regulatory protein